MFVPPAMTIVGPGGGITGPPGVFTVTVTDFVSVCPFCPVAMHWYVVVAVGFTVNRALPPRNRIPFIVSVVALFAWHASTTAVPGAGDGFGVAVNDVIDTGGITFTVTVVCAVTLP